MTADIRNPWDKEDPNGAEAVRKINAEMLQLDNHRFFLTTTAVVFVGTAAGWTTTTLLGANAVTSVPTLLRYVPPAVVLLIWIVLFVLFAYQLSLARTVRWLAAYQMHRGSAWEWTWHAFRLTDPECAPGKDAGAVPFAAHHVITTVFNSLFLASFLYLLLLQVVVTSGTELLRWPLSPSRMFMVWGCSWLSFGRRSWQFCLEYYSLHLSEREPCWVQGLRKTRSSIGSAGGRQL
jgi:hypothetical protein